MRAIMGAMMLALASPVAAQGARDVVEEQSIETLAGRLARGEVTSEALVRGYMDRIARMNRAGPRLNAVIALNPQALEQARAADRRRRLRDVHSPLLGVPILIKDNIETADPVPTTAGSLALAANITGRDAPVVARLRAAGAIILGKANLSEWANIRSTKSMSGWSAVGGLVRNPYALDRTACGSSSGSGAGVAASLAAAAVGTETDGSVVCPAAVSGLVGLKPTIGMVSRTHVVPISHSQDTPGPMARSVRDAAMLYTAMVGSDPADAVTSGADARRVDFAAGLSREALRGKRVGVIRTGTTPALLARFDAALAVLRAAGATLVEVTPPVHEGLGEAELNVLLTELKADLNSYLATTPRAVKTRTLDAVIAFNRNNASREMPFFAQELFEQAAKTKGLNDPTYRADRAKSLRMAGREGIDAMLAKDRLDLLVSATYGPAWLSDPVYGDQYGGPSASELPAIAGTPHLTVPMGLANGLPVGLSFMGPAFSDAMLLNAGYAYEQRARARVRPGYVPTAVAGPGLDPVR